MKVNEAGLAREYSGQLQELCRVFKPFNLLSGASNSDFEQLSRKILDHLYKGVDPQKIEQVVESELIVRYGLYANELSAEDIAAEIISWWQLK